MLIPEEIRKKLSNLELPSDQKAAGMESTVDLVQRLSGASDGFYFICPRNKAGTVVPLIQAARSGYFH